MADRVLKLEVGNAVLLGDDRQFLTCSEQREGVLKPRSTVGEDRLSEGAADIGNQVCMLEAGERKRGSEPVGAEHDALQVTRDDFGEHSLSVAHDDELAHRVCFVPLGLAGVVEKNLGTVREELLGGKCVLNAHLSVEPLQRGADALQGDAGPADRRECVTFGEPNERDRRTPLAQRTPGRLQATPASLSEPTPSPQ
jgi:hypothetical protein